MSGLFDAADDRVRRAATAEKKAMAAAALADLDERIAVLMEERDRALRDWCDADYELNQLTKPPHLRYENQRGGKAS